MKMHLAFAAILSALSISRSAARADALIVIGEGPERACYAAAKTSMDMLAGIASCNLALNNALVIEDRVATLVNRGVLMHKLERVRAALDDFNNALRINPEQAEAWLNRGVAKLTLQQYADGLVDIQKGIDLGPSEMALAYFNRAIAYENLGRISDAYFDYQRSLKAAPNFIAAANALSRFKVTPRK